MSELSWLQQALEPAAGTFALAAGFAASVPRFAAAGESQGMAIGYRVIVCLLIWLMLAPVSLADQLRAGRRPERAGERRAAGGTAPRSLTGPAPGPAAERDRSLMATLAIGLAAGLLIGLGTQLVFVLTEAAALLIEPLVGLAPLSAGEGDSAGPVRQLYSLAAWSVLLILGGHRAVLRALLGSAQVFGSAVLTDASAREVARLLGEACGMGLQLAGPVLAALLAARLVAAWAARLVPQFPGDSLAGIVFALFGLALVMVGLPALVPAIEQIVRAAS